MPVILTDEEFAALAANSSNNVQSPKATGNKSASPTYEYKSNNPGGEATDKHKFDVVKLVRQKDLVGFADQIIEINGETIDFDEGPITWSQLVATEKSDQTKSGRHYPVIWGLTDGEAVAICNFLIGLPDRPKADTAKSNNFRRNSSPKATNDQIGEADLARVVANAVAQQLQAMGLTDEPAKPVPATNHRRSVSASPKTVEVAPTKLEPGMTVEWQGQLFQLTLQSNGRIGQQKVV